MACVYVSRNVLENGTQEVQDLSKRDDVVCDLINVVVFKDQPQIRNLLDTHGIAWTTQPAFLTFVDPTFVDTTANTATSYGTRRLLLVLVLVWRVDKEILELQIQSFCFRVTQSCLLICSSRWRNSEVFVDKQHVNVKDAGFMDFQQSGDVMESFENVFIFRKTDQVFRHSTS